MNQENISFDELLLKKIEFLKDEVDNHVESLKNELEKKREEIFNDLDKIKDKIQHQ